MYLIDTEALIYLLSAEIYIESPEYFFLILATIILLPLVSQQHLLQ